MGDLTKQSFMDAWNSDKYQALRAAHLARDDARELLHRALRRGVHRGRRREQEGPRRDDVDDRRVRALLEPGQRLLDQVAPETLLLAGATLAGALYLGKVTRIMNFGAFVEIFPGTDGLLHVSQISKHRVNVADCFKEGDEVLISSQEHHSNILPWRSRVATDVFHVSKDGTFDLDDLSRRLLF